MPRSSLTADQKKILRQILLTGLALVVLFLLVRTLGGIEAADVLDAARKLPPAALAQAVALAAFGYVWLIGYDYLALRYLNKSVPKPRLAFTSMAAFALQRNVGPGPLTGGALRYRYLRPCGISGGEAAILTLLCGLFFSMGIALIAGLALLLEPQGLARVLHLQTWPLRLLGALLLLGLAGLLWWTHQRNHAIRIRNWRAPPPSIGLAATQLLFGVVDIAIVAGVAYVLLPDAVEMAYPAFVGLYVLAMVAGALSHVPGGLGVFESVLMLLLPGADSASVLASLLTFRGVYYLLPLLTMGISVGLYETFRRIRGRGRPST